jgi:hypothetical protein
MLIKIFSNGNALFRVTNALKKTINYFTDISLSVAVLSHGAELFYGIVSGLLSEDSHIDFICPHPQLTFQHSFVNDGTLSYSCTSQVYVLLILSMTNNNGP